MPIQSKSSFQPTSGMIAAARAMFMVQALEQSVRPVVEAYETEILARHQFPIDPKWQELGVNDREVILNRKDVFLLKEEDFKTFLQESQVERDKHKLKVARPDNCPLLEVVNLKCEAQRVLMDCMEPITGMNADNVITFAFDKMDEYVGLCLSLLAPYVGTAKEILEPAHA